MDNKKRKAVTIKLPASEMLALENYFEAVKDKAPPETTATLHGVCRYLLLLGLHTAKKMERKKLLKKGLKNVSESN